MNWNRKEVAGLLMVGASIIAGFETALFGKWVDAMIHGNAKIANIVAWVGFGSMVLLTPTWIVSRVVMSAPLPKNDRPKWKISGMFIAIFVVIGASWLFAALL